MSFGSAFIPHLIAGLVGTIIITVVCVTLIISYIKSKNTNTLLFIGFVAFTDFWAFGSTFYPIVEANLVYPFAVAAISSSYIGFYSLFLFLELINYDKINLTRAVFFSSLISGTIILMVINPFYEYLVAEEIRNFGYLTIPSTLFSIFQAVILIGIGLEYFITAYRIRKVAVTPAQKDQAIWFMAGVVTGVFGNIIASIIRLIINFPALMLLVGAAGMFLAGMAFVKDPDVAFVLPFEVQNLMVINYSGISLYSKYFDPSKEIDEVLISGMITAITGIMEEALGIKSDMREIVFGDRHILLDLREKIGVFIVSNTSSGTLKIALKKFTDYFESEFYKYLDKPAEMSVFKPAEKAVEKYLGFLPGAWKSN